MAETFEPTDITRKLFKHLAEKMHDISLGEFFELWEAEDDPRKAGSVVAAAHMRAAARVAVFGAVCAGLEPQEANWLELAKEQFDQALIDVGAAFQKKAEIDG